MTNKNIEIGKRKTRYIKKQQSVLEEYVKVAYAEVPRPPSLSTDLLQKIMEWEPHIKSLLREYCGEQYAFEHFMFRLFEPKANYYLNYKNRNKPENYPTVRKTDKYIQGRWLCFEERSLKGKKWYADFRWLYDFAVADPICKERVPPELKTLIQNPFFRLIFLFNVKTGRSVSTEKIADKLIKKYKSVPSFTKMVWETYGNIYGVKTKLTERYVLPLFKSMAPKDAVAEFVVGWDGDIDLFSIYGKHLLPPDGEKKLYFPNNLVAQQVTNSAVKEIIDKDIARFKIEYEKNSPWLEQKKEEYVQSILKIVHPYVVDQWAKVLEDHDNVRKKVLRKIRLERAKWKTKGQSNTPLNSFVKSD